MARAVVRLILQSAPSARKVYHEGNAEVESKRAADHKESDKQINVTRCIFSRHFRPLRSRGASPSIQRVGSPPLDPRRITTIWMRFNDAGDA
jgi:hypothetical protein